MSRFILMLAFLICTSVAYAVTPCTYPCHHFTRADVDKSGGVNTTDVSLIMSCVVYGTCPAGNDDVYDSNDDGSLDVSDPVYAANYAYSGGPAPPPPFVTAGADPTPDSIEPACDAIIGEVLITDAALAARSSPNCYTNTIPWDVDTAPTDSSSDGGLSYSIFKQVSTNKCDTYRCQVHPNATFYVDQDWYVAVSAMAPVGTGGGANLRWDLTSEVEDVTVGTETCAGCGSCIRPFRANVFRVELQTDRCELTFKDAAGSYYTITQYTTLAAADSLKFECDFNCNVNQTAGTLLVDSVTLMGGAIASELCRVYPSMAVDKELKLYSIRVFDWRLWTDKNYTSQIYKVNNLLAKLKLSGVKWCWDGVCP